MSKHPWTARFRDLAQESEDGWAINQLCDELDKQYRQSEAALTDLADGVTA